MPPIPVLGRRAALLLAGGLAAGLLTACGDSAPPENAQPVTGDVFRQELVGVPLCGVPKVGPFAGKSLCTVHLPDGTAVVAGSGILARARWSVHGDDICRRDENESPDRNRCVSYQRIGPYRFRNSDGVEFCIGPCA